MNSVYVTNTNARPHRDKYDGEEYIFPPKEAVLVPTIAATHMLGYLLEDKTPVLQRLGIAFDPKTFEDNLEGANWLAGFTFEEAVLQPPSALRQAMARSEEQKRAEVIENLL